MKVFVARVPEAPAPDDFHHALDGELVTMPIHTCPDPGCRCARAMAGLGSAKATTCFTVVDLEMTFTEYVDILRDGYCRQGWWAGPEDDGWLLEEALLHATSAALFPVGAPLQAQDGQIALRRRVP